jgi:hypothetical protein
MTFASTHQRSIRQGEAHRPGGRRSALGTAQQSDYPQVSVVVVLGIVGNIRRAAKESATRGCARKLLPGQWHTSNDTFGSQRSLFIRFAIPALFLNSTLRAARTWRPTNRPCHRRGQCSAEFGRARLLSPPRVSTSPSNERPRNRRPPSSGAQGWSTIQESWDRSCPHMYRRSMSPARSIVTMDTATILPSSRIIRRHSASTPELRRVEQLQCDAREHSIEARILKRECGRVAEPQICASVEPGCVESSIATSRIPLERSIPATFPDVPTARASSSRH